MIGNADAEAALVRATNVGINIVATSSVRVRSRSKFGVMVKEAKCCLVLGDIKEQTVFSNSGFRESNNQVDIGYLHVEGNATKVKLPKYLS